jgi:hypothetical protein
MAELLNYTCGIAIGAAPVVVVVPLWILQTWKRVEASQENIYLIKWAHSFDSPKGIQRSCWLLVQQSKLRYVKLQHHQELARRRPKQRIGWKQK